MSLPPNTHCEDNKTNCNDDAGSSTRADLRCCLGSFCLRPFTMSLQGDHAAIRNLSAVYSVQRIAPVLRYSGVLPTVTSKYRGPV